MDGRAGTLREAGVFRDVGERVQRRLAVAHARQFVCEIARLPAQVSRLGAHERLQQPQQRAPALHRLAVVVNRDRVRALLVLQHRARLGQHVARDGLERVADRNIRTHGGFLGHAKVL